MFFRHKRSATKETLATEGTQEHEKDILTDEHILSVRIRVNPWLKTEALGDEGDACYKRDARTCFIRENPCQSVGSNSGRITAGSFGWFWRNIQ